MNLKKIALVLIDIQKDFWAPLREAPELKFFPEKVANLLSISRERRYNIIHVRSVFRPDRSDWMLFYRPEGRGRIPCISGTEGIAFTHFAKPIEGEKIIEKQTFDAFIGTQLDDYLQSRGVNTVLIAGLETSICVLFTANSAYLRKYLPLVVSDACGDTSERHKKVLEMYVDLSFKKITTDQLTWNYQTVQRLIEAFV